MTKGSELREADSIESLAAAYGYRGASIR